MKRPWPDMLIRGTSQTWHVFDMKDKALGSSLLCKSTFANLTVISIWKSQCVDWRSSLDSVKVLSSELQYVAQSYGARRGATYLKFLEKNQLMTDHGPLILIST